VLDGSGVDDGGGQALLDKLPGRLRRNRTRIVSRPLRGKIDRILEKRPGNGLVGGQSSALCRVLTRPGVAHDSGLDGLEEHSAKRGIESLPVGLFRPVYRVWEGAAFGLAAGRWFAVSFRSYVGKLDDVVLGQLEFFVCVLCGSAEGCCLTCHHPKPKDSYDECPYLGKCHGAGLRKFGRFWNVASLEG